MGNSACGSGGDGTCCATGQPSKDAGNMMQPQQQMPSSEIAGIDNRPAPGFTAKTDIIDLQEEQQKQVASAPPGPPGADSAAGGDNRNVDDAETVTYDDGSTFKGQVVNGKRQGNGVWQSRTGQYEGQWQADMQHGTGHQTWSDGRIYDGQFDNGKFSGKGKMVWHTQKGLLTYEGEYKEDLKHGMGKFVWADGRTYDGSWQNGKRHGRGSYINARAESKVGYWVEDKFDRWEAGEAVDNAPGV